jgi:predicted nucleotide-binding protein
MAKINQRLLGEIKKKTGLRLAQVYARIKQAAASELLPRHLAAIKVAADAGVTINKYASGNELAELRRAGAPVTPPAIQIAPTASDSRPGVSKSNRSSIRRKAVPNSAFVVHGRDRIAKDAVFSFLRAVGIKPIEWNAAIGMTKKATPYIGDILDAAFSNARAVVVLLTPDDWAQLREDLVLPSDPAFEKRRMGQARPNVLFEAGMAFSSHPDRTVLVQIGTIRPFSDTAGRHVVHMSGDAEKRRELATKLKNAGCNVDLEGTDWLSAGNFSDPEMREPPRRSKQRRS